MDMSWSFVSAHPSPTRQLVSLFELVWPIAVAFFLRRRVASAAPALAMLIVLGVVQCGIWLSFVNILEGLSISGSGRAARAAGLAEALGMFIGAALSMLAIAVVALIKRHQPLVDRMTAAIAAALAIQMAAMLLFASRLAPVGAQVYVAFAWAAIALVTTIAASIWLVRVHRGRVEPVPLRGAVLVVALSYAVIGVTIWQQIRRYVLIAMTG